MALFASIPHSGLKIPPSAGWLKKLHFEILMCDPDAYVDQLYKPALTKYQVPFFVFEWHRYAVDVNRFAFNISPQTVEGAEELLKAYHRVNNADRTEDPSPSDIHWQKTTLGWTLIKKPLSQRTHQLLIEKYFKPYHQKLKTHIESLKQQGKRKIYLLDLHSMPSKASSFHKDTGKLRTEVVIGDNEGKSCSPAFRDLVLSAYQEAGFKTALNDPYKGGAITKTYGQPSQSQEALQVELNRKLYMNENTKEKNKNFPKIQDQLKTALSHILKNLPTL